MKTIEEKILKDGKVIGNEIVKVDNFLNHLIDVPTIKAFAQEVREAFDGVKVDKVLTIETSGIAVAFAVCEAFGDVPLLFAKKSKSKIVGDNVYTAPVKSFTRGAVCDVTVDKNYLCKGENVLIVDDFLAEGNASLGLLDMCEQAGANVVGVAIVIEKTCQGGHDKIVERGIKVYAGASIKSFKDNKPVF